MCCLWSENPEELKEKNSKQDKSLIDEVTVVDNGEVIERDLEDASKTTGIMQ